MKRITTGAMLVWLCCACATRIDSGPPMEGGGSLVGGRICFQHEAADGGWEPIRLVLANGKHPIHGSTAVGPAYFPADAGRVRVMPNCEDSE